jgi:serine/threonine protein kinase
LRKKLAPNIYLAEKKVRNWCSDLFAAVAYLHGKEIAHRDIKTDNFILSEENRPLLCDFSFALLSDKPDTRFECMADTVCGTTSYLAPEVHSLKRGHKYNAKLVDVFALGISLYEMLVKVVPYQGKWSLGDPDLVKRQMAKDYTYPNKIRISSICRILIELLLEPIANNRITINRALANPWFEKATAASKSRSKKSTGNSSALTSSEEFRKQTTDLSKKKEVKSTASSKSSRSAKSTRTKSKKTSAGKGTSTKTASTEDTDADKTEDEEEQAE